MISEDAAARREVANQMAEAARAWLETLDAEQREVGQGVTPDDDTSDNERRRWFYTPTDHGGLTVHQQRPAQQRAAMRLISTGLSPAAYVTVATIMGLENVLDYIEGFVVMFGTGNAVATLGCTTCGCSASRAANGRGVGGLVDTTCR